MPVDPRMFEPNPGRDPRTNIHSWDQPLYPRGDMPIPAPGVDPMSYQTRIEYENARQAALAHEREMAHRAQTAHRALPAVPTSYVVTRPQNSTRSVVQNVSQSGAVPAKLTPEPPRPKYKPVKYLVFDERVPSSAGFWATTAMKITGICFLTGLIFSFMLFMGKGSIELTLMIAGMAISVLCWLVVVYRANIHSLEKKPTGGNGPFWIGVWLCFVLAVILFIVNRQDYQINLLALIGLVAALFVNGMHDGAEGITEEIVKMRQARHYFQNGTNGQKCRLCGDSAIAMRRYFFTSPNIWKNYIPVCTKHQHYICTIDGFGKTTWPQSGDCTQPGLIKAKPKYFT